MHRYETGGATILTSLASLKIHLGLSTTTEADEVAQFVGLNNTSEDVLLAQLIGVCSDTIRGYAKQWIGSFIDSNATGSPTVITCYGHGLQTGDVIVIAGSNCTPTINGERVVTVIDDSSFSVPVAVTIDGTRGYFSRKLTEYYSGNGSQFFKLRQRPVQSITSVYLDSSAYWGESATAFASSSLLTAGQDYALVRDNGDATEQSISGQIARLSGVWDRPTARSMGLLSSVPGNAMGNIKVTYTAGFAPVPLRYQLACQQMCASVRNTRSLGGAVQSESYDYYSYQMAPAAEQALMLGSVKQLLGDLKEWVW